MICHSSSVTSLGLLLAFFRSSGSQEGEEPGSGSLRSERDESPDILDTRIPDKGPTKPG